jgi:hypothetical protein
MAENPTHDRDEADRHAVETIRRARRERAAFDRMFLEAEAEKRRLQAEAKRARHEEEHPLEARELYALLRESGLREAMAEAGVVRCARLTLGLALERLRLRVRGY